ncbi:hypothetical protein EI555_011046, partial [Monodon monoceros]
CHTGHQTRCVVVGSRILRKGSPTIRRCESSRDQLLDRRPRAATETLQRGQATDPSPGIQPATSHVAGSTRENPGHRTEWPRTLREKRPPPGSKMAASALPLLPPKPPPGPQKRDKDVTPPRSQRPGSDLRLLLQSGQQEGGSPESGASRALLRLLLPPRLHRLLSDSSFCRSRRGASRTTRAEHSPAGASSAAASGARGAVDRLAVQ